MRIAILTEAYPSLQKPDARAFIHARAGLYQQAGHTVQVFTEAAGSEVADTFESVAVLQAPISRLHDEITRFRPQVIAFHTPYAGTPIFRLAAELADRYALVAWLHGYEAMMTAFYGYHVGWRRVASLPWDLRKLWGLSRFLPRCRAVVYVSQWLRGIAERGMAYRHPDSRVIHNPVDTQQFAPAGEAAAEEFTGRPLRGVALRGLGRIYGLDIAIRAYTERPETDLTIIGTGPLAAELRSLIAATGSHTTLVAQSLPHAEIPGLLRSFDYFVAPSRNETQGVAMCEAMACGLPVVATHVGGIPEFVRDGMDGYLVPPENPAALHAAIKRLVADPARLRAMGRDARQHMQDVCSGAVIARQELALLAEAAV